MVKMVKMDGKEKVQRKCGKEYLCMVRIKPLKKGFKGLGKCCTTVMLLACSVLRHCRGHPLLLMEERKSS